MRLEVPMPKTPVSEREYRLSGLPGQVVHNRPLEGRVEKRLNFSEDVLISTMALPTISPYSYGGGVECALLLQLLQYGLSRCRLSRRQARRCRKRLFKPRQHPRLSH